jgi:hypothetical protein
VFEGLLPEPHNNKILQLLFTFAHWHGLAKLRMHSDATIAILDDETTVLGEQLRGFESVTCAAFKTKELPREAQARKRRKVRTTTSSLPESHNIPPERKSKTLNLQTYKFHSLGDYVSTIKCYGTTDSYTTSLVSIEVFSWFALSTLTG